MTKRSRECWEWIGVAVISLLTKGSSAASEEHWPPPRVQLVAFWNPYRGNPATLCYAEERPWAVVKQELTALAQRLGKSLSALQQRDRYGRPRPLAISTEGGQTAVQFRLPGEIIDRQQGVIHLAPFIEVWKEYRSLALDFFVALPAFNGLQDYEDRFVRIRFRGQAGGYSYLIWVKDPGFEALSLPLRSPPPPQPSVPWAPRRQVPWMLIMAVAGGSGLAIFFLTWGITRRRQRRSRK
ncbi:MAG TPA: hypothetical protein EYP85_09645 [Armatimonadetes bacterium]|nr:hypothetical protein [Armatimonadota bacterium]